MCVQLSLDSFLLLQRLSKVSAIGPMAHVGRVVVSVTGLICEAASGPEAVIQASGRFGCSLQSFTLY